MARGGGKRRTYVRDANGRFASTPGGGGGLGAARKAARSQSGRASTLQARTSLKKSRAKLAGKDKADQTLQTSLSTRAQKGAVTRGNKGLRAAKVAARTRIAGGRKGVIGKPKGLKPGALAAQKKATASKSFNKVDISLDGIKKRRQRALAPKNSTYLSQKMETKSAIVRSAANAIYNRQRRTVKELGVSPVVIRQPIGIMPGLTGSNRTRAMTNLENARKRVLSGRKGRR